MKFVHILAFVLLASFAYGQNKDLNYYYSQALDAYKTKDYPRFYEMIREAHTLHPYHQGILYQLGIAAALTGHPEEAIENLKKAILVDATFRLEGLPDFNAIKNTPGFIDLLKLQQELKQPIVHSDTAFVIHDRSLHTEGIEFDRLNQIFYLGSIHKRKIIKVKQGQATDFCSEGFEGMTSLFGIKVDSKRNLLWACSSPMQEMLNYDSAARSAVFKFDLTSGKLLAKFKRPTWDKDGVFGDLILNSEGEAIVSDSQNNALFKVNEKTHLLEPYFSSSEFWNIQGLTFTDNGKYLFISDYIKGIFRLDLKTKILAEVKCNLDASLKGIDGLIYYKQSLIAIQNGTNPLRASRYFLNGAQDQIIKSEIIDRKHPAFNEPTLGVVDGNTLYYIANSQWGGYDRSHHIKPDGELQDIVILKFELDHPSK